MVTGGSTENGSVESEAPRPTVVGLGASAGGLVALRRFFAEIPEDSGLAFVIVMHLSPEHESRLAEILQPFVKMPIQQVTESVPLEPNRVYVIPPNANLNAVDTHLRLTELQEQRRERAPIDHFLRTLSSTHDGHAIAVILTGTGSDGALGLKAVKEKGGLAVVQDPVDAEFDGMPQSAIATSVVDLILPLDEIPAAILSYAATQPDITRPAAADTRERGTRDAPTRPGAGPRPHGPGFQSLQEIHRLEAHRPPHADRSPGLGRSLSQSPAYR